MFIPEKIMDHSHKGVSLRVGDLESILFEGGNILLHNVFLQKFPNWLHVDNNLGNALLCEKYLGIMW